MNSCSSVSLDPFSFKKVHTFLRLQAGLEVNSVYYLPIEFFFFLHSISVVFSVVVFSSGYQSQVIEHAVWCLF